MSEPTPAVAVTPDPDLEFATPDEVEQARKRHCHGSDNEIEIDEPAKASRGADGMWVQAWVWIPTGER